MSKKKGSTPEIITELNFDSLTASLSNLKVNFLFISTLNDLLHLQGGGAVKLKCFKILLVGKRKNKKGLTHVHLNANTRCTLVRIAGVVQPIGNQYLIGCNIKNDKFEIDGPAILSFCADESPIALSAVVLDPQNNKALSKLIKQHKIEPY